MAKPRVMTACPANRHTSRDERIVEFSFPGRAPGGMLPGGLIALRNRGTADDPRPTVEVYRTDGEVRVISPSNAPPLTPEQEAKRQELADRITAEIRAEERQRLDLLAFVQTLARLLKDGEETPEHPDGFDMPSDDAVDTIASIVNRARDLVGAPSNGPTLTARDI